MNTHGFYIIDKPAGLTSFQVCAKIRKHTGIKKVGHTGTLDPFATGILLIAIGKATKCIPYFEKAKKTYTTTIVLGKTSETLDIESEIQTCSPLPDKKPTLKDIESLLKTHFEGEQEQIPPIYSALKIEGKRAYALARAGVEFTMKSRKTTLHNWKIESYTFPRLTLTVTVSAGFYIRSLARDIGEKLFGGGYCESLRRIGLSDISIEDAQKIEEIGTPKDPKEILSLKSIQIDSNRIPDFASGRAFVFNGNDEENLLVHDGEKTIGIGYRKQNMLHPRIVLIPNPSH